MKEAAPRFFLDHKWVTWAPPKPLSAQELLPVKAPRLPTPRTAKKVLIAFSKEARPIRCQI